jgi:uroporphyrinogen-III synthase
VSALAPVLTGCRVLVTAQRRSEELAEALTRRGAEVLVAPVLGVLPQVDEETLLARTRQLLDDPVDVLVVTTGVGFRGWLETAEAAGLAEGLLAVLARARVLARGPKARGALLAAGVRVDWVAASETAAEIADHLLEGGVSGLRVAVQHHGAGDDGLDDRLTGGGATVVALEVYRWGPPPDPDAVEESVRQVAAGRLDAVVFTSAPAASAWLRELAAREVTDAVRELVGSGRLLLAAVGPVTAEPLVVAGLPPVVPERFRMGALVRRVVEDLGAAEGGVRTGAGRLRLRAGTATLDHAVLDVSDGALAELRRLVEPGGPEVAADRADPELAAVPGLLRRGPHGWVVATGDAPAAP